MRYHHPLKKILSQARSHWDRDAMPATARGVFSKALQCRTPELGAEVYSSENQELILGHTCKSRACPSCGYRATVQWQRERWVALPNESYRAITFTMPDLLWFIFRDNPRLAKSLPALAAGITQVRVGARYGVRIGAIAILHTFNGKLGHLYTCHTGAGGVAFGYGQAFSQSARSRSHRLSYCPFGELAFDTPAARRVSAQGWKHFTQREGRNESDLLA